jgi:hypothetical protein
LGVNRRSEGFGLRRRAADDPRPCFDTSSVGVFGTIFEVFVIDFETQEDTQGEGEERRAEDRVMVRIVSYRH